MTTTSASAKPAVVSTPHAAPAAIVATVAPPRTTATQPVAAAPSTPAMAAAPAAPPAAAPVSAGPVQVSVPESRRRPRLRVGQVVCWQVAAGGVAGLIGRGWVVDLVAGLVAVVAVGVTATWWRGLWSYQWLRLAAAYLVRGTRFIAMEGMRGQLETGAGTIVRSDGVTVLLESDVPPELQPADLLDEHDGLRIKLLRRPGRAWIALTALRSADRPQDTELELLLANTVRRLTKRLRRRGFHAEPLGPDELSEVLATLTPKHLTEEWDALVVGGARFRMYVVPPQLALQQAGAIAITTCSDLDHALVLAAADAPPAPGAVPQTGRHRSAFVTALP